MPTPVTVARQCLTQEAAHALDEAVAVARRRGHAQTTSLHAVSALLALPTSMLRDACARARNAAYSSKLQFKALELCLSVSLDRVPSSQLNDDPPVSNSLMAAIKRSQANQRRQPENFHLYHQLSQQYSCSSTSSSSSLSCVKVELQHLILSILDDPVVSRVFGEAGFRSPEIKLAILRPIPQLLSYTRTSNSSRGPPLFLGSSGEDSDSGRSVGFPFFGYSGMWDGDGNCKRIGEVLRRSKGRNPLLVGVCAYGALRTFIDDVDKSKRKEGVFPVELSGVSVVSIENDVRKFVVENCDRRLIALSFDEVGIMVERCLGPGIVVNYGDLKIFVDDNVSIDSASYVVTQLTRLLDIYGGKVWLVGAAASYETYLKFVSRFPSVEKDWDLQLLPITSLRPSMAETYPRSSLMESFVPFGGLFSAPSEIRSPLIGSYQSITRCHLCDEKCEQEINALVNGGNSASVADHYWSSLPPWLQTNELGEKNEYLTKTRDFGVTLSTRASGLQKKWDIICQHLHHRQLYPGANLFKSNSRFQTIMGFQVESSVKENADKASINNTDASSNEANCSNVTSCKPLDMQRLSTSQSGISFPVVSKTERLLPKLWAKPAKAEDLESRALKSPPCSLSNSNHGDVSQTSPTSVTSVTTDLGLGISSACNVLQETENQDSADCPQDLPGCYTACVGLTSQTISKNSVAPSTGSFTRLVNPRDIKMLHRALMERIYWQCEAIGVISNTIAYQQTGKKRGDIWFSFTGLDRLGKKKTAIALAEILYGSREYFVSVNFDSLEGLIDVNTGFSYNEMIYNDVKFRGKTVIDYVVEELRKKPLSVVFLENADKADVLAQSILSQAVLTGKLSDSHGREVSINNAIFVLTSGLPSVPNSSGRESLKYSEEGILGAKCLPVKILLTECTLGNNTVSHCWTAGNNASSSNPIRLNKRKLICPSETTHQDESSEVAKRMHKLSNGYLDLNLPAQANEMQDNPDKSSDDDAASDNTKSWFESLLKQMDKTVVFKRFDFDELADKVSKEIYDSLSKVLKSQCSLEIDTKVMQQLLAVSYLSERDRTVEDWVEEVLSREFAEVGKRYNLTANSIVKLVTCEGLPLEEQALGVCPPPRIMMN